ncbi:hypothetical protein BDF22DRAFT_71725 [Syncephalis plumigaleata]|nr:hypothetical protein BDF22DRAFT_71725 [Syncephalis plumigaleata]
MTQYSLMLSQPISSTISYSELEIVLAKKGADMLLETLGNLSYLKSNAVRQDTSQATKAPKIKREMAMINWNEHGAQYLVRLHRAIGEKIPLETTFRQKHIQLRGAITASRQPPVDGHLTKPGTVVFTTAPDAIFVKCAADWIQCTHVQVANKRMISARDWINAYSLRSGEVIFGI